jgi:hypothetical protein
MDENQTAEPPHLRNPLPAGGSAGALHVPQSHRSEAFADKLLNSDIYGKCSAPTDRMNPFIV